MTIVIPTIVEGFLLLKFMLIFYFDWSFQRQLTVIFYIVEPGLWEKRTDRHEYTYSLCKGYSSCSTFHLHREPVLPGVII